MGTTGSHRSYTVTTLREGVKTTAVAIDGATDDGATEVVVLVEKPGCFF